MLLGGAAPAQTPLRRLHSQRLPPLLCSPCLTGLRSGSFQLAPHLGTDLLFSHALWRRGCLLLTKGAGILAVCSGIPGCGGSLDGNDWAEYPTVLPDHMCNRPFCEQHGPGVLVCSMWHPVCLMAGQASNPSFQHIPRGQRTDSEYSSITQGGYLFYHQQHGKITGFTVLH